jgi:hypothetical protein
MSDDNGGRGQPRMGGWLGDFEDLVGHEADDTRRRGEPPLQVRKLWNPVTYRCAFCGESFVSKAMIRRHLERHAAQNSERVEAEERAA